jgi:chromate transporter
MIYLLLIAVFFTIGLFTIGGGYAMIPMIQEQVVSRGWLTDNELLNFFAIAESTPGPFAVNTATLVGFKLGNAYMGLPGGLIGAVLTTMAVILPSFIIILIIAKYIQNFLKYRQVQWAMNGIKAVVVGLLLAVVFDLFLKNVFGLDSILLIFENYDTQKLDYISFGIMILVYITKRFFPKLGTIFIIILSGAFGILFSE